MNEDRWRSTTSRSRYQELYFARVTKTVTKCEEIQDIGNERIFNFRTQRYLFRDIKGRQHYTNN